MDIASQAAPDARIDNQLEVESVLPTDVNAFQGDAPTAEMAETSASIRAAGGDIDPDFTDRPGLNDPILASGADTSGPDDPGSTGEVYTPPVDPVVRTDAHGAAHVLGGFSIDSAEDSSVEPSAMDDQPGDEALADAIRRELAEDSATADLEIVVAVRKGVAHLRGQVPDLDDADNAESVAARARCPQRISATKPGVIVSPGLRLIVWESLGGRLCLVRARCPVRAALRHDLVHQLIDPLVGLRFLGVGLVRRELARGHRGINPRVRLVLQCRGDVSGGFAVRLRNLRQRLALELSSQLLRRDAECRGHHVEASGDATAAREATGAAAERAGAALRHDLVHQLVDPLI